MLAGTAAPAAAQSWPGDSGPNGDMLGLTMRQYERLAPPPVEAERRAERVVPGMSAMDLAPRGSVEVGSPATVTAACPASSRRRDPVARATGE